MDPQSLDEARLRGVLTSVLDLALPTCAQVDYRLVGTAAAVLHGVSLPAGDADILVRERASVDAFAAALAPCRCLQAPAWLAHANQYYASFEVDGVEVELSTVEVPSEADTIETLGRGPWEHFVPLACGPYAVPTVALELRLITELWRNRPGHYQPLVAFMRQHGCDLAFIRRGVAAAGMAEAPQAGLLRELEGAPFRAIGGLPS